MTARTLAVAAAVASCGSPRDHFPAARFANAPVVWLVDDRRDVPKPPSTWTDLQDLDGFDSMIERPITRALELPRARRALGVNALDEVPDSTWFTNRIGIRDLSLDELARGPVTASPEQFKPWTVRATKPGGTEDGLMITDARGVEYMLKFDGSDTPEVQTGTHVIVNRILWACGYHVPEDSIVSFSADDLIVAPGAKVKTRAGLVTRKLTREELVRALGHVAHAPDGRVRALASRWLDGTPIGGPPHEGERPGDPNDRIPHQLRRDLRGEYPIFAWVDHLDLSRGNFVDMWIRDPHDPHRHYVEHFQIDFGMSLGEMGASRHDLRYGRRYELDYPDFFRALVTFGLNPRPWQHGLAPTLRGVAPPFVATGFDPSDWHSDVPYTPAVTADRFDKFWGATLMARFSREQIRAIVEAARFSDPRATAYVTDTLVARQRATLAYWFARVNPLDRFTASGAGPDVRVCFDDLAITTRLAGAGATRYAIVGYGAAELALGGGAMVAADASGRTCFEQPLAGTGDGYTIFSISTRRGTGAPLTYVHVARERGSGAVRVVGIWRM